MSSKRNLNSEGRLLYLLPLCFVFLCLGVIGHIIFERYAPQSANVARSVRISDKNYPLVEQLLLCSDGTDISQNLDLKRQLSSYITKKTTDGSAISISVYAKELKTNLWAGVNENDRYSPASLVKVPLMFAYFKQAQENPVVLEKRFVYDGTNNDNASEVFKPAQQLEVGKSYSVDELVRYMIVYSDNNAYSVLLKNIDAPDLVTAYTDLNITLPPDDSDAGADFMSAKLAAHFFRVLYNATYLNREYSQKALALLSQSSFGEGIVTSVPAGTTVAHKFGERTEMQVDGSMKYRELHDCGIVYGQNPYAICVMTKGADFKTLSKVIADIGTIVFSEIGKK